MTLEHLINERNLQMQKKDNYYVSVKRKLKDREKQKRKQYKLQPKNNVSRPVFLMLSLLITFILPPFHYKIKFDSVQISSPLPPIH